MFAQQKSVCKRVVYGLEYQLKHAIVVECTLHNETSVNANDVKGGHSTSTALAVQSQGAAQKLPI